MGLPLFTPPVESDVPCNPPAKNTSHPSYARSPIGRADRTLQRRRHVDEPYVAERRERGLRMLAALQASEFASSHQTRNVWQPPRNRSTSRSADADHAPGRLSERYDNEDHHRRRRRMAQFRPRVPINPTAVHRHPHRVRYVDGLGDRDRSLSPEGDGVWDTLQSTLTPDPQPPSVNSSFTSTIISNTTPHNNGPDSVNTSITTPNEEMDQPCDPVMDNSGSDGEEDVEERPIGLTERPMRHGRPSYADVAAELQSRQSSESTDTSDPDREWLSGMHLIVRRLASRGDIPDEWWAQAGLSRSMSWEDSS